MTNYSVYNTESPPRSQPSAQAVFFPVSGLKLVVMSTVAFSIYEVYWFYRNWKFVKEQSGHDIWPFWRAIFSFFFCYSLFKDINHAAGSTSIPTRIPAGPLALLWIGVSLCWRLPDPYWLVSCLAVFALLPAQKVINQMNAEIAPNHDPNSRFSAWNIVGVVLGGLWLLLAVIGTFLPE